MTADAVESRKASSVSDQMNGMVVDAMNMARRIAEEIATANQDAALRKAVEQLDKVRDFIGSPGNILGNSLTKHGEVAEQVEVGIRNARQAVEQMGMTATFDGVRRLDAVDYLIDGVEVQSKFINGVRNNLRHVLEHLHTYKGFTTDGAYYVIPKDTHEAIQTLLNGGHVEGLKETTEESIKAWARQIEMETGKPFSDVVKPSVAKYSEVQLGKVEETLNTEEKNLAGKNRQRKEQIHDDHKPSLQGAAEAAAIGAAVGGGISLATGLFAKYRSGKNVFKGDFTEEDWREIGLDILKGTAGGAIAAGSIYVMTNYAEMSAPLASSIVSAAKGMASLSMSYQNGEIGFDEFVDLGVIVCAESAIVGLATAAGQAVIPIPVLGGVIGSMAGKFVVEFATKKNKEIEERLREDINAFKAKLDAELKSRVEDITAEFDRLGDLTVVAFDFKLNRSLLDRSIELACAHQVDEALIITSHAALDAYMLA